MREPDKGSSIPKDHLRSQRIVPENFVAKRRRRRFAFSLGRSNFRSVRSTRITFRIRAGSDCGVLGERKEFLSDVIAERELLARAASAIQRNRIARIAPPPLRAPQRVSRSHKYHSAIVRRSRTHFLA